jgi:hypothetical protein
MAFIYVTLLFGYGSTSVLDTWMIGSEWFSHLNFWLLEGVHEHLRRGHLSVSFLSMMRPITEHQSFR